MWTNAFCLSWLKAICAHRVITGNIMITVPSKSLTNVCTASIQYISARATLIDIFAIFSINRWSHYRSRCPFRRFETWWWHKR